MYDNGDIVSIVCDASSHGTHVAGITAACHSDAPELNGVAPGAQLVSIKIGDIRLDSLETGTGLIRGFAHCVEMGVDLINLSFGESSSPAAIGAAVCAALDVAMRLSWCIAVCAALLGYWLSLNILC